MHSRSSSQVGVNWISAANTCDRYFFYVIFAHCERSSSLRVIEKHERDFFFAFILCDARAMLGDACTQQENFNERDPL